MQDEGVNLKEYFKQTLNELLQDYKYHSEHGKNAMFWKDVDEMIDFLA